MTPEELEQIADDERASQGRSSASRQRMHGGRLPLLQSRPSRKPSKRNREPRLGEEVKSKGVGCMGLCAEGRWSRPEPGTLYQHVAPAEAPERSWTRWKRSPVSSPDCRTDVPFFQRQKKIVLENSGIVDPERIEDYMALPDTARSSAYSPR